MCRLALAVLIILFSLAAPSAAERRVALVIGNGDYGSMGRLANPANDANAMAGLLATQMGFEVIKRLDADYDGIRQAMIEFGRAAADADVALFFYAGHGIELDGANYMLPVGADIRTDVELINLGFRLDQVVDSMVRAGAKIKIVLVDACRNNPLASRGTRGAQSLGLKEFYATNVDTLIAFATEPGRVAYDGEGGHSPFTAGLIEHLAKPDVEVQSTLRRVRSAVYEATRQRQFPWWDDMFLSDVYLGGRSVAQVGLPLDQPGLSEDIALCQQLGDGGSRLMMEAYLDRYPQGFCAAAIRKRLGAEAGPPPSVTAIESPAEAGEVAAAPVVMEAGTGTAGQHKPGEGYSVSSYWNHNDSVMALSAQGDSRVFYYEKPREVIARAGVRRGTLLFKGRISGETYSGKAYLFSTKCAPIAYEVSGRVSPDFTRVELRGDRPVRDQNCRLTGTKPDRLVFEYRSKSL